ncbi:MAG: hypothetical protein JRJ57_00255 [Deltaproteobacteria bacterium]|nr:hypothetical protein [Deltaproteobacteria bacterium]
MEHSATLKTYLNYTVGEVPREKLREIIDELSATAMVNMGGNETTIPLQRIIESITMLVAKQYYELPISKVASAFWRGSLGELGGTTRFTLRNVNLWLKESHQQWGEEHIREMSRKNREKYDAYEKADRDVITACRMKIMWRLDKRITPDQSDKIHVEDIVHRLRDGFRERDIIPEMFLANEHRL